MKVMEPFGATVSEQAAVSAGDGADWVVDPSGLAIGFLANGKTNSAELLAMLQKRIAAEYDFRAVKANKKLEANGVGLPSIPEILERMSAPDVALVIAASGDWGGCTSWSVHDSVELEKRGVHTITICTDMFEAMANFQKKALGKPGMQLAIVSHPFGFHTITELEAVADELMPLIKRHLAERSAG